MDRVTRWVARVRPPGARPRPSWRSGRRAARQPRRRVTRLLPRPRECPRRSRRGVCKVERRTGMRGPPAHQRQARRVRQTTLPLGRARCRSVWETLGGGRRRVRGVVASAAADACEAGGGAAGRAARCGRRRASVGSVMASISRTGASAAARVAGKQPPSPAVQAHTAGGVSVPVYYEVAMHAGHGCAWRVR
jgi:hypothetical protein